MNLFPPAPLKLDRARFEALTEAPHRAVQAHYLAGPPVRAKVFETLNALASVAGATLASTERDADALREFFDGAVDQSVAQFGNAIKARKGSLS